MTGGGIAAFSAFASLSEIESAYADVRCLFLPGAFRDRQRGELPPSLALRGDAFYEGAVSQPLDLNRPALDSTFVVQEIVRWLRANRGIDFGAYRAATLERRVMLHVQSSVATTVEAYLEHLENDPHEADRLISRLTIKVSSFFRGAAAFDELTTAIMERASTKREGEPFRVWSAACGHGEEPYSIAILLSRLLPASHPRLILATDLDRHALEIARRGVYPEDSSGVLPGDFPATIVKRGIRRFVEVSSAITRQVSFEHHDLCSRDLPRAAAHPFDLVLCRNALIYWSREMQNSMQSLLLRALAPDGILCLGEADWVAPSLRAATVPLNATQRVFRHAVKPLSLVSEGR
jgi:chemotaxis methyl-accepting protein methylase